MSEEMRERVKKEATKVWHQARKVIVKLVGLDRVRKLKPGTYTCKTENTQVYTSGQGTPVLALKLRCEPIREVEERPVKYRGTPLVKAVFRDGHEETCISACAPGMIDFACPYHPRAKDIKEIWIVANNKEILLERKAIVLKTIGGVHQ